MNIFVIEQCPIISAMGLVDKHVTKMCVESAQLLSTAHRVLDGVEVTNISPTGRKKKEWKFNDVRDELLYANTHINHPSAIWARATSENYLWLYNHFVALGAEYTHRYGKQHLSCIKLESILKSPPSNIPFAPITLMPSCMDDKYKVGDDPIENYRNYYAVGKASLHQWSNRLPPLWMQGEVVIVPRDDDTESSRIVYTIKR